MPIRLCMVFLALFFLGACEKQRTYLEKPSDGEPEQPEPEVPPTETPTEDPRERNRKAFTGETPLEALAFLGPKFNQRYVELRVNYDLLQKGKVDHVTVNRAIGDREAEPLVLLRPDEIYYGDEEIEPLGIYLYHLEVVYSDGAKDYTPKVRVFVPPHDTRAEKPVTGPLFSNGYNGFGRVFFEKNLELFTRGRPFKINDVQELHLDGDIRINTGSANQAEALALSLEPDFGLISIEVDRIVGGTLIFEGEGLGGLRGPDSPPIFVRVRDSGVSPILDLTKPKEGGKKLPVCFLFGEERVGDCKPETWEPYGITVGEP